MASGISHIHHHISFQNPLGDNNYLKHPIFNKFYALAFFGDKYTDIYIYLEVLHAFINLMQIFSINISSINVR